VTVSINGKPCLAEKGEYLLDIAARAGVTIPCLCRHESLSGLAACRLCLAEVNENGRKRTVTACVFPVETDISVETETVAINSMRKTLISLLLAEAPGNERIIQLAKEYGAEENARFSKNSGGSCILCGLCVKACGELGLNCLAAVNRGTDKKISAAFEEPPEDCIGCGACAHVCPTACIKMEDADGKRLIWGREFEMLKCASCGGYFMPREQSGYLSARFTMPDPPVCGACAQARAAKKILGTAIRYGNA
jgi:NADH dehydrogenase/NADH:ubiquinone oxidoreductase subunit G